MKKESAKSVIYLTVSLTARKESVKERTSVQSFKFVMNMVNAKTAHL